jgi:ATP citrate (pro-S)-lyase
MTRGEAHPEGKVLIIGGGAANFSDVAATFKGIIRALKEYKEGLLRHKVKIWVRRAGPNYQEGLKAMRLCGESIGVFMKVYGPEAPITAIVPMALGISKPDVSGAVTPSESGSAAQSNGANGHSSTGPADKPIGTIKADGEREQAQDHIVSFQPETHGKRPWFRPFDEHTRSFVFGLQPRAIQGMLDFDFSCGRKSPSVAAMIYPFGGHHIQKFYWGTKETLLPVYTSVGEAIKKHPDVDVVVNFSSSRSVYASTLDILTYPQIKAIGIIAEGVPERHARELLHLAVKKDVIIIGPATVGGIKPGCFRIGNTGGMMDNLIACKLYRAGSVGYVSKSGGMSNELNNILSYTTNGVYEGVAIGGDRYPGTSFIDHLLRYQEDPDCKLLLLLGEVGGTEEYRVIQAVKEGKITKPIVAWAIGTCAKMFTSEVQFGHAGSMANSDMETADAKNRAMRAAGFIVPDTFEDLPTVLKSTYQKLVSDRVIVPKAEVEPPNIPMDYNWASKLGLIRKPAAFISTISDERGQELMYSGMRISDVFKEEIGIGGVISLLWFKRRLPPYACKFIEMVLQLTADHGPAVSGAMNAIITARAGKDLISCLVAGLLTIGDRFGGALDGAANEFSRGLGSGLTPREFVDSMRKANRLIPGIGHKIKSKTNPDLRVSLVVDYVQKHFPSHRTLDYALAVEDVTTQKSNTLILNVDGAIAVSFCDLLSGCGAFSEEEAQEYLNLGILNGLFVLGRSIGLIGHVVDQKRLRQPLYRYVFPASFKHVLSSFPPPCGDRRTVLTIAIVTPPMTSTSPALSVSSCSLERARREVAGRRDTLRSRRQCTEEEEVAAFMRLFIDYHGPYGKFMLDTCSGRLVQKQKSGLRGMYGGDGINCHFGAWDDVVALLLSDKSGIVQFNSVYHSSLPSSRRVSDTTPCRASLAALLAHPASPSILLCWQEKISRWTIRSRTISLGWTEGSSRSRAGRKMGMRGMIMSKRTRGCWRILRKRESKRGRMM